MALSAYGHIILAWVRPFEFRPSIVQFYNQIRCKEVIFAYLCYENAIIAVFNPRTNWLIQYHHQTFTLFLYGGCRSSPSQQLLDSLIARSVSSVGHFNARPRGTKLCTRSSRGMELLAVVCECKLCFKCRHFLLLSSKFHLHLQGVPAWFPYLTSRMEVGQKKTAIARDCYCTTSSWKGTIM